MARCPFATWKPLPANATQSSIRPRAFIIHAPVDSDKTTSLFDWYKSQGNETHFYITRLGGLEQYMDTEVRADAQFSANAFAISVEVWDGRASHPDTPTTPMGPNQMATLESLANWACDTHGIPRHLVDNPTGSGIGWHEQFPEWNHNGHDCPGPAREEQITDTLIPALQPHAEPTIPPQEDPDDMAITLVSSSAKPPAGTQPNAYYAVSWPYRQHLTGDALNAFKYVGTKDMGTNDVWLSLHTVEVPELGQTATVT